MEEKVKFTKSLFIQSLDLNKKHTRKFFKFKDPDADKEMLVELRSNDHYSMCGGKYEDDDHVKWFEASSLGETTYDALYNNAHCYH